MDDLEEDHKILKILKFIEIIIIIISYKSFLKNNEFLLFIS
jgi:hypothetical protein